MGSMRAQYFNDAFTHLFSFLVVDVKIVSCKTLALWISALRM